MFHERFVKKSKCFNSICLSVVLYIPHHLPPIKDIVNYDINYWNNFNVRNYWSVQFLNKLRLIFISLNAAK